MATEHVNVRVTGELRKHLDQQTGVSGLYDNASEYVRDLIRHDLRSKADAWNWLKAKLEPGLCAEDAAFRQVSAEEIIARSKKRLTSN